MKKVFMAVVVVVFGLLVSTCVKVDSADVDIFDIVDVVDVKVTDQLSNDDLTLTDVVDVYLEIVEPQEVIQDDVGKAFDSQDSNGYKEIVVDTTLPTDTLSDFIDIVQIDFVEEDNKTVDVVEGEDVVAVETIEEVELCEPTCLNKECGSDGCGDNLNCGNCSEFGMFYECNFIDFKCEVSG